MAKWIDFKALRESLSFRNVLHHYQVEIHEKGDQHHGFCPLPTHQGKRNSASFSVNLKKGIFQCFGCGAKGNVIDFACRMEGLDPEKGSDVRKTALELQKRFLPDAEASAPAERAGKSRPAPEPEAEEESPEGENVIVNAPLDFSLKKLDPSHPYLYERGFTKETIERFGLGYADRGMLRERIAIPIHDPDGNLVGYAGRTVDDNKIGRDVPKYKFPPKRERDGYTYVFRKSELLYNAHRLERSVQGLIVVEGFPSVWWLHQAGLPNVVAIMGSSMSGRQAEIVVEATAPDGRIWLMPDGDEAGTRCAENALSRIAPHRSLKWLQLSAGKQPTDCTSAELSSYFL